MRIGITERGDAACDMSWKDRCEKAITDRSLDGAVVITKNLNGEVYNAVLDLHWQGFPVIVHATTTGWGGTKLEQCQPYGTQLAMAVHLLESGFPADRIVIRVDPIFPNKKGLERVQSVLFEADKLGLLEAGCRVRISILDEYTHVKHRFLQNGFQPLYGNSFYAPEHMMAHAAEKLCQWAELYAYMHPDRKPVRFETCAEDQLSRYVPAHCRNPFVQQGCISMEDLEILGLEPPQGCRENPQNRRGCHCLDVKTELLNHKHPCRHKCLYCYWKD